MLVSELVQGLSQGVGLKNSPDIPQVDFETAPNWFHAGQLEGWRAEEDEILLLCGSQSGKTSYVPYWLLREIQRKGPGDYGLNGPSIELLRAKCLPGCLKVWETDYKLGRYNSSERTFTFTMEGIMRMFGTISKDELLEKFGWRNERGKIMDPEFEVAVRIRVGYAAKPESLESSTFKAVASDECGQPLFGVGAYEALQRRRARYRARHLMVTTPYDLGWLKTRIYDKCKASGVPEGKGEYCEGVSVENTEGLITSRCVVRFESWLNPTFGRALFDQIRKSGIARWKFDLFYRGIFTRPAGAIYDTFDDDLNTCVPFRIPDNWQRVIGIDFGQTNMASAHMAINPNSDPHAPDIYLYRTYHGKEKSTPDHVSTILLRESTNPPAVGGSAGEDEWREKFADEGLYVTRPVVSAVEPGIDSVYQLLDTRRLKVFDTLTEVITDFKGYSRELDKNGEPIPKTVANKHSFHRLDAIRYVGSEIVHNPGFWNIDGEAEDFGIGEEEIVADRW